MNPRLSPHRKSLTPVAAALAATLLVGCATSGNPRDPFEGFNRAVFDINDGLDKTLIKPVAQSYETVLPAPVRKGVSNFFGNIGDVFIAANNLLQGKPAEAATDVGRFAINSTFGVLGIFDFATDLGLEKHEEDFGQTFGRWGAGSGPYLVLPILGPSTFRDGIGLALDLKTDPVAQTDNVPARNTLIGIRAIDERAGLLTADKILEEAALDRYAYTRDAYLQRRRSLIYDGNAPREEEDTNPPSAASSSTTPAGIRLELVIGAANLYVEQDDTPLPPKAQTTSRSGQTSPYLLAPELAQLAPTAPATLARALSALPR